MNSSYFTSLVITIFILFNVNGILLFIINLYVNKLLKSIKRNHPYTYMDILGKKKESWLERGMVIPSDAKIVFQLNLYLKHNKVSSEYLLFPKKYYFVMFNICLLVFVTFFLFILTSIIFAYVYRDPFFYL